MDINDPAAWSAEYVSKNLSACVQCMKEVNARVITLYREGDYPAAVVGINHMLSGAQRIQSAAGSDMHRFLAAGSFVAGLIVAFDMRTVPDDKRRETAVAGFLDAQDFMPSYHAELISRLIKALQSGRPFDVIRVELCPNWRDVVFNTLQQNYELLNEVRTDSAPIIGQAKKKSRRRFLLIAIAVIIALIGAFNLGRLAGNKSKQKPGGNQSGISSAAEEPVESTILRSNDQSPTEATVSATEPTQDALLHYEVKDAFAESYTFDSSNENGKLVSINYPSIIIDLVNTDDINREIIEKYDVYREEAERADQDDYWTLHAVSYDYSEAQGVLSVCIMSRMIVYFDESFYQLYSFDLHTGRRITDNSDMLALLNLDEDTVKDRLRNAVNSFYEQRMPKPESSVYDFCLRARDKTLSDEVLDASRYFVKDGSLCALVYIYNLAGGERSFQVFEITSL